MSASILAALLADFGFVIRALREIGAQPDRTSEIMTAALRAKTILTLFVSLASLCIMLPLPIDTSAKVVLALVWIANFASSFGDTALIAFRSLQVFAREVKVIAVSSAIHMLIVAVGFAAQADMLQFACLYLAARLIYAVLAYRSLLTICSLEGVFSSSFADFRPVLRSSSPYALDSIATNVLVQLDGIIVASVLGLHIAGIYQAGSRLLQGMLPFAAMLASFHIPQLARQHAEGHLRFGRQGIRLILEFVGLGLVGSVGFLAGGPVYVHYFLAPSYAELNQLWFGFAIFVFARFVAGGLGTYLIVHDMSYARPFCTLAAGAVMVMLYFLLLPIYGVIAAPWVGAAGSLVLIIGFTILLLRMPRTGTAPDISRMARPPR